VILKAQKVSIKCKVKMTKGREIAKKVEVSNAGTSMPPQWDRKKGDTYLI
jgi:hypothetical protein